MCKINYKGKTNFQLSALSKMLQREKLKSQFVQIISSLFVTHFTHNNSDIVNLFRCFCSHSQRLNIDNCNLDWSCNERCSVVRFAYFFEYLFGWNIVKKSVCGDNHDIVRLVNLRILNSSCLFSLGSSVPFRRCDRETLLASLNSWVPFSKMW